MRNLIILIIAIFTIVSCKSSYDSAATYDDVYYSTKKEAPGISASSQSNPSKVVYGGSVESYQQTSEPQSVVVGEGDYKTYSYVEDTLPAADDEYYYVEDEDQYYDYDYASRIDRFHNSTGDFGYYAPVYSGYYPSYGSSMSFGYGWGMPSSYFSVGFNYGWGGGCYSPCYGGYPYYGYGYPYYGYGYGGSYSAGYNNGYWNGYYAGSGGYYPGGETIYPSYYYGPRDSRGSTIIANENARDSRVNNSGDDELKNSVSSGRGSRVGGGAAAAGTAAAPTRAGVQGNQRASRTLDPTESALSPSTRGSRSEKLTKPESGLGNSTEIVSERASRQGVTRSPESARKYAKPGVEAASTGEVSRSGRSIESVAKTTTRTYNKPASSSTRGDIHSRVKKYAKPATESLSGNSRANAPKKYTSPNTNRPRSSNEYTVPRSNPSRTYSTPSRSNNNFNTQSRSSRSYSTPSRSGGTTSSPSRSYNSPSKTYSSPSRSNSSPSRSSGSSSGSYSSPSRSSGSSSGSGSRSSGSSSGGKRGR